jgi:hypothetical protein
MAHNKEETTAMVVRLPPDAKTWVEREAARCLTSQNSEILRCIRDKMNAAEQSKKAAG